MKKALLILAFILMAMPAMLLANGGSDDDREGKLDIGANIYSFADNFMNGVMKPELERYAAEKG